MSNADYCVVGYFGCTINMSTILSAANFVHAYSVTSADSVLHLPANFTADFKSASSAWLYSC